MCQYWLVLGSSGSVWGSTGWYLVELGQYWAVVAGALWYWVSMGRYWLVLGGTGSVLGGSGWYLVVLCQYWAVLVGTWCGTGSV